MVDRKRIELFPKACKAPVLPLSLTAHKIGWGRENRTPARGFKDLCTTIMQYPSYNGGKGES